jgi:ergothioneine biosynthesis protein EgtB
MAPGDARALIDRFRQVRRRTEALAAPLSPEDQQLQSMPSCSPTKWHRAHTTWFFEEFVLGVESRWRLIFNSYYQAVGPRHPRPRRGMLSRPSCDEIAAYRAESDERVLERLTRDPGPIAARVELGLAHEEQHQELILTDALHALGENPLRPSYRSVSAGVGAAREATLTFSPIEGGLVTIGAGSTDGFAFDNEFPRHQQWLEPFALADRLVTVGEVRAFAADGGYRTASLWLSDGWDLVQEHGWHAPGHTDDDGRIFGLDGLRTPSPAEPAAFLSFYEADAIARWMNARLPTEAEWEIAARGREVRGTFVDDPATSPLAPQPASGGVLAQLFGDCWEWTRSSYEPYPGFAPADGALGEYNGKFMINQRVLRGGSCFTPVGHVRATYRNFWHPDTRFQVTGVRLARSA